MKTKEYQHILNCPFCGSEVELERIPLWNGSHGYIGCYEYVIECKNSECRCKVNLGKNDTIYRSDDVAKQNAINSWNRRA